MARSVAGDKSSLAALLLVGGIGLSLSLVTVDALKGARQRLYDTIRASPGLHVNELRRRLRMSPSAVEYHLAVLTGAGLVVSEDDGRYKRFYANGAGLGLNPGAPNSRNALGALRRPHAVGLVRHLIESEQGATARELSRLLGIHESAVSRRLSHLEDGGLLVSQRTGRARVFRVRDRSAATRALTAVEEAPPIVATSLAAPQESSNVQAAAPTVGMRTPLP
jgi:DNA-binding transcriptional ArsR family regulator